MPPDDSPTAAIIAPLSGELVPLEAVPDPVFSQKMVGEGVAIDPLSHILCAPCDGEIAQLHPGGHAITVVGADGVQVLMHIGLDTVKLRGAGFLPKVKRGDKVLRGAPLIEFDMDFLAMRAKSLLTLVVVTNSDKITSLWLATGMVEVGKDRIFSFMRKEAVAPDGTGVASRVTSPAILIPNATGLHVRTSAVLANAAKMFRSEIQLYLGERQANAKSVTAIMGLDARQGAKVVLSAQGPDSAEAVAKLADLMQQGMGETASESATAMDLRNDEGADATRWPHSADPNLIFGVAASPGLAVGNVCQIRHQELNIVENAADPDLEREVLKAGIVKAREQLAALCAQSAKDGGSGGGAIFAAHAELVDDPALVEVAFSAIAKGKSAAFAWSSAFEHFAKTLAAMSNPILAQRAEDLRDVGERVLALLTGTERKKREYPANAILITEELTPSDTFSLDRARIKGFCTTRGGATSHVSILARSLGIPSLAGIQPRALEIRNGELVILDASRNTLRVGASMAEINDVLQSQKVVEEKYQVALAHARDPAVTTDGVCVKVVANIDNVLEARRVEQSGGEGVGLLRTEFLFSDRVTAPTEDEQFEIYKSMAMAMKPGWPLVVRTLDVGGDKSLPFLPICAHDNPAFGERGIRVALDRPDILRTQLRALLRASAFGNIRILFPMVSLLSELREARAMLGRESANLGVVSVPAGIMVENPAAALMTGQFAKEADFFSIGTNDLTQYTLAMDRGHPKLAPHMDGLNPAVLRLIAYSVNGARTGGRSIAVCGGIAGDAHAIPILVGLGLVELSISLPAIPAVKAQIRSLDAASCRRLAGMALDCNSAGEVRALVEKEAPAAGTGSHEHDE